MLPRSNRLSVPLFAEVLAKGSIVHSPIFTARILKTAASKDTGARFSVAISKKISKTAVERHKLRRKTFSALRPFVSKLGKGLHVILLGKSPLTKAKVADISIDLKNLFVKSGLLK